MRRGTILRLFSGQAEVLVEPAGEPDAETGGALGEIVTASLRGRLGHRSDGREKSALAAGDRVVLSLEGGDAAVSERLPRTGHLSRSHPRLAHLEQVIAANVDRVLIVASPILPPVRPGLIDRYLVAASAQALPAALCLTKCDLANDELLEAIEERWQQAQLRIFRVELVGPERRGLEALRDGWLTGHATVLVGQSAVGKSTLRNALLADSPIRAATGAVSDKTGRGRHVTTAATFEPLTPSGFLVDTPGSRQFAPWNVAARDVPRHYPEFADAECRFSDCLHGDGDPGCGLALAVAEGRASAERLDSLRAIAASFG